MSWIVGQTVFARNDLFGAFPETAPDELETLLDDLVGMKVVARGT